jgi:hypothetical protein
MEASVNTVQATLQESSDPEKSLRPLRVMQKLESLNSFVCMNPQIVDDLSGEIQITLT